jgi:hypothetical protein
MNTPKLGENDIINLTQDHMVDHPAGATQCPVEWARLP